MKRIRVSRLAEQDLELHYGRVRTVCLYANAGIRRDEIEPGVLGFPVGKYIVDVALNLAPPNLANAAADGDVGFNIRSLAYWIDGYAEIPYSEGVRFEWDEDKNESNRRKHGISFETAALVFEDPNRLMFVERIEEGEERWHAIGAVRGSYLFLTVVHTYG